MGSDEYEGRSSIYEYVRRDKLNWTRKKASLELEWINEDRLERIEKGRADIQPEEVIRMAEVYDEPALCNHYCAIECPLGKGNIPHIDQPEKSQLPIIVLQMIASLNNANQQKDRLIEIASDGDVTDDELEEFEAIQAELEKITETVKTLELWAEKAIKKSKN